MNANRKILFLGTAQDGGVPQAGCSCTNCRSHQRNTASIAIIDGNDSILIDVSPDFRRQFAALSAMSDVQIEAVYLTHAHWGHYGGLMIVGKESWNVQGMPVYLSRRFSEFLTSNQPFRSLFTTGNLVARTLGEDMPTHHGITPVLAPHRGEFSDVFGFRIDLNGKQVLYLPDTDEFDEKLQNLIRKMDISIIDGTFYSVSEIGHRDISQIPHPRVVDSAEIFADIADRIIFTHLNHTNPLLRENSAQRKKIEKMGYRVAMDGDVLE